VPATGHAPPVAQVHEQREEEEQDPHRARVEAVEQAERDGDERQAELRRAQRAEGARLDGVGRRVGRRVGAGFEQLADARAGRGGALESDHERVADPEGRHAGRFGVRLEREALELAQAIRVAVDLAPGDAQIRPLELQLRQERARRRSADSPRA
jgi:hypothetical protein